MIHYTTATGNHYKYPTAHLALLNWFVDQVENDSHQIVNVASSPHFLEQMLAAVERHHGKIPRVDRSKSEEAQCETILRFIFAAGGIRKLRITP